MYFSRIRLSENISHRELAAIVNASGYKIHKHIWTLFTDGPDRKRDFLYRHETVNGRPTFFTVSEREPKDPAGLWDMCIKPYAPKLMQGDRLAFKLRANPVQLAKLERTAEELEAWHKSRAERGLKPSKSIERGWTEKVIRHDVVMEAKTRIDFKNLPDDQRPHVATLIQEAGFSWLKDKENVFGFYVEDDRNDPHVRADGYCQHKLFKGKGNKPITFGTLDFNGILTVTNPDVFVEKCLFEGIGPAKGFGCGLMLVRRV